MDELSKLGEPVGPALAYRSAFMRAFNTGDTVGARKLPVPSNITLLPLPARSPELNPVENLWQFLRDNWHGNRIFQSYDDILDHCCDA